MSDITTFLYKWQTLVGSVLGGIFALLVAFLVGHIVRRREEISSAMLLISDLASVRLAWESLMDLGKKQNILEKDYPFWFAEKLTLSFPKLSAMFESSTVRMMPISSYLAAHLALFQKIFTGIQVRVDRLAEDFKLIREGKQARSKEQMAVDVNLIYKHFPFAVQHAGCAEHLLSDLILSKVPTWHRLRQTIYPKKSTKECMKHLKEGGS